MEICILIIGSYLLGSVPFGLLIARLHGKDLRSIGSGNIGATNVSRALGKKWACVCFCLDVLKGLIPMIIAGFVLQPITNMPVKFVIWIIVGTMAVVGHIFPVYIRFKGGKGVATSLGIGLGVWPYYTVVGIITFAIWIICVLTWRYISLASMIAGICFPILLIGLTLARQSWKFVELWPLMVVALLIPLLLIIRHKDNIKRLIAGTEDKISSRATT